MCQHSLQGLQGHRHHHHHRRGGKGKGTSEAGPSPRGGGKGTGTRGGGEAPENDYGNLNIVYMKVDLTAVLSEVAKDLRKLGAQVVMVSCSDTELAILLKKGWKHPRRWPMGHSPVEEVKVARTRTI